MATAVYPGSFDPITLGHLDIIKRTAAVFDKVIIGVLINKAKKPLFSIEERVELIKEVTKDIPNVEIVSFNGLLIEFSDKMKAARQIRQQSEFFDREFGAVFFPWSNEAYIMASPCYEQLMFPMIKQYDKDAVLNLLI